mmetsp:Transcript_8263/g.10737  ORF Transcript_8263/g.10737 Transcript_8263/m.10737 type:complete len:272 (+) Transcript_8263:117-932(+)
MVSKVKGYKTLNVPFSSGSALHHMYIKEHKNKSGEERGKTVLFVCNASTSLTGANPVILKPYLKSLFSKFGVVEDVSVGALKLNDLCRRPVFAHIVFSEKASLKKALRSQEFDYADVEEALQDAGAPPVGLQGMIKQYKRSRPPLEDLEESANKFMQEFEQKEEEDRLERERRMNEVDDDGFTLVTYKKSGGPTNINKRGRPDQGAEGGPLAKRGTGRGRSRNKKKVELKNFYRFQMREAKRDQLVELRKRFEEDKKKIEKLKAGRKFKPF